MVSVLLEQRREEQEQVVEIAGQRCSARSAGEVEVSVLEQTEHHISVRRSMGRFHVAHG